MKRSLLILFFLTIIGNNPKAQGIWSVKSPLPGQGRMSDLTFTLDSLAYMGLGYNAELWCYNSVMDKWSQKGSFPGLGRSNAFCFSIGNAAFYGGGSISDSAINDFWKYNAASDSWQQLNNLPAANPQVYGFAAGNRGFILSGTGVYEYSILSGDWTMKSGFPGPPRKYSSVVVIDNKAFLAFGDDGTYGGLDELWQYDIINNTWTQKKNCPVPRFSAYGFGLNHKGYFGGGYRHWYGSDLSDFYEYDPSANTWASMPPAGGTYASVGFDINHKTGYYGFGNVTCHIGGCNPLNFLKAFDPENTSPLQINKINKTLSNYITFNNPVIGELEIKAVSEFHSDCKLQIKSLDGRIVKEFDFSLNKSEIIRLNIAEGVYLLSLELNNARLTEKLIVFN
jgi:N-acetylneuraminic acid mutarotase